MTRFTLKAIAFFFTVAASIACAQTQTCDQATQSAIDQGVIPPGSCSAPASPKFRFARVYIEPNKGVEWFEPYLVKAFAKKQVPAVVTQKKDEAQFVLTGTAKSGGIGAYGYSSATVQLIDAQTHDVVWTYHVLKPAANAQRSDAEAIAKELRAFIEAHPNEFEVSR